MPTRYQQLRQALSTLAAPADEQAAYLDRLLGSVAGNGSVASYGNDELALGLDDIFCAAGDMIEHGELTEAEAAAVRPVDDRLARLSGESNVSFWRREALRGDERWDDVRSLAKDALACLRDENRRVGRSAGIVD